MRYLTLELLKNHLHVEHDADDTYIEHLGDAAEVSVENYIDQPLEDILMDGQLPSPVRHAMLLEVGTLYANRESVSFAQGHTVPLAYSHLLTPYIHFNTGTE